MVLMVLLAYMIPPLKYKLKVCVDHILELLKTKTDFIKK